MRLEPHPCARGCIWRSFFPETLQAWHIFQLVTKRWEDQKTKEPRFEIDWQAVDVVFGAYGIEDRKAGIDSIFKTIGMVTTPRVMSPEELFGWSDE